MSRPHEPRAGPLRPLGPASRVEPKPSSLPPLCAPARPLRNVALQKCNSPTTDDCVEEVEHMVIADCLNADTSTGYCPQSCKAAIALSPLNKDARCREVVASYLNDLGEN